MSNAFFKLCASCPLVRVFVVIARHSVVCGQINFTFCGWGVALGDAVADLLIDRGGGERVDLDVYDELPSVLSV